MHKTKCSFVTSLSILIVCSCTGDSKDVAAIRVDYKWQKIDYGSQENPEIKLAGVPEGTKRFSLAWSILISAHMIMAVVLWTMMVPR